MRNAFWQKLIAAHSENDTGQAQQQNHNYSGQANENTKGNNLSGPVSAHKLERGSQRRALHLSELIVGNHARGNERNHHVQEDNNAQTDGNAERNRALWLFSFLSSGGDNIETDKREEDESRARENATETIHGIWQTESFLQQRLLKRGEHGRAGTGHRSYGLLRRHERREVANFKVEEAGHNNKEDNAYLHHGKNSVEIAGNLRAHKKQNGKEGDDNHWCEVNGKVLGYVPLRFHREANKAEEFAEIEAPVFGNNRGSHKQFENKIPTDNPRDKFTQSGVGKGIRRASSRNHRCELRVAERHTHAGKTCDKEAHNSCRTRMERDNLRPHRENTCAHGYSHSHHSHIPDT